MKPTVLKNAHYGCVTSTFVTEALQFSTTVHSVLYTLI